MEAADVPAVAALGVALHPSLPEGEAAVAGRLRVFPAGCLVLADGSDLGGYAVAFPARYPLPPPLDAVPDGLPPDADALYLHDLAVRPAARGRGLAREGVDACLRLAEPYGRAMLVAVSGTAPFWRRFGFREAAPAPGAMTSYGGDAVFMWREVSR